MPSDFPSQEQLSQYLAGELSGAEAAAMAAYLDRHPGRRGMLAGVRAAMHGDAMQGKGMPDVAEARVRMLAQLATVPSSRPAEARHIRRDRRTPWLGRARASYLSVGVALVALVAVVSVMWNTTRVNPIRARTYATAIGEQRTMTLSDGSIVALAPQSQLVLPANFGKSTRTVTLRGRAYFTIAPFTQYPFAVQTGSVITRVLGTAFDIRHYDTDASVQIAVVTGKVAASGSRSSITLTAGTVARVTDSTTQIVASGDAGRYADWTRGELVFKGTPVPVVLDALSHWYGYDFRMTDSALARQSVWAKFRTTAPQETLTLLKQLLNVTMTFDGSTVILRPLRESASPPRGEGSSRSLSLQEVGK